MRRNVVLIDFESVQPDSIEALDQAHFEVLLFCGAHQTKVPLAIAAILQKLGARAQYVKIAGTGPNALDFHIAYYIGRIAAADPGAFFHIVSRDKGFDPLIQHLKVHKILSARSESIDHIPLIKNSAITSAVERANLFIAKLKEPKTTRPRTAKTMASAIKSHFQPAVDEMEANKILEAMIKNGFVVVEAGKIVYATSET